MMLANALALGAVRRGGRSYDPDAQSFFDRLPAQPSAARKLLINDLVVAAKDNGWWAETDALHLMAFGLDDPGSTTANDAVAARNNLRQDASHLTAFSSPAFTTDRGYQGDGAAAYLSTNFNPTSSTSTDISAAVTWQLTSSPASGSEPTESPAGTINFNSDGTNSGRAIKSLTTVPGATYRVGSTIGGNVVNLLVSADSVGGASLFNGNQSVGASVVTFVATTTTSVIMFNRQSVGAATVSGVTCRQITSNFVRNDANFAIWSLTSDTGVPSDAGYYGGADGVTIQCRNASDLVTGRINQVSVTSAAGNTDGKGLYDVNRSLASGAGAVRLSKNGSQIATATDASTALLNASLQYLRYGTTSYSARQLAVGIIGGSLTPTQATARYNDLLTYLQAVGAVA